MRNEALKKLNFTNLIHYENNWPDLRKVSDRVRFVPPSKCTGYCTACEDKGVFKGEDSRLDLMSHASDSHDFECLLGPMPLDSSRKRISEPIMFVLESPGGDHEHGAAWDGINKRPPVNTYYFVPDPIDLSHGWITEKEKLSINDPYSPFLAYLMSRFHLTNVYITNVVKCGRSRISAPNPIPMRGLKNPDSLDYKIRRTCYENFFSKELEIFKPVLIFVFGRNAFNCLDFLRKDFPEITICRLIHPAARGWKRLDILGENETTIGKTLNKIGLL